MMGIFGSITAYLVAGFIGFLIGVILSSILLARKNIAFEKELERQLEDKMNLAKEQYKKQKVSTLYQEDVISEEEIAMYFDRSEETFF